MATAFGSTKETARIVKMCTPKPRELKSGTHRFIREGPILQWNPKERRHKPKYFFLFDQYLLVTKREGKKKYWLKVLIKLRPSIKVVFVKNSSYHIPGVEFRVYAPKKSFIFFGKTPAHTQGWIADLLWCCQGAKTPRPTLPQEVRLTADEHKRRTQHDEDLLLRMQNLSLREPTAPLMDLSTPTFNPAVVVETGEVWDPFGVASGTGDATEFAALAERHAYQATVHPGASNPFLSIGDDEEDSSASQQADLGSDLWSNDVESVDPSAPERPAPVAPPAAVAGTTAAVRPQKRHDNTLARSVRAIVFSSKGLVIDAEGVADAHPKVNPDLEAAVDRARLAVDSLYAALANYDAGEDTEDSRATLRAAAGAAGAEVARLVSEAHKTASALESAGADSFACDRLLYITDAAAGSLHALSAMDQAQADEMSPGEKRLLEVAKQLEELAVMLATPVPTSDSSAPAAASTEAATIPTPTTADPTLNALVRSTVSSAVDLLKEATHAQLAVKADARRRDGPVYHEDPAWQEGLVSAAEFVVKSVRVLAMATTRAPSEWEEGEFVANMLAGSRGITGAVARVCSSAAAKLEPSNAALTSLNGAAGRTRSAANKLAEHARTNYSSLAAPEPIDESASAVDKASRQLEAMAEVARLEQQLEKAHRNVAAMNKSAYKK